MCGQVLRMDREVDGVVLREKNGKYTKYGLLFWKQESL